VIRLDSSLAEEGAEDMNDFTLPANIKQIGSIGNGLRIYMEDYVCTFLHQYATGGGYDERLAYLVGRHMLIGGQSFLFISGAMYGMYTDQTEGLLRFSQKSAEYAETMLEEHFPGQEIVGWMQSQPSYGTYLNQHYASYHIREFTKPYQVLFVMDPLERVNAFYVANPNAVTPADRLTDVSGYFIYYEKNVNMHEYMLTNKSVDYSKPPTFVELTPVEPAPQDEVDLHDEPQSQYYYDEDDYNFDSGETRHISDPEEVIRRHRANTAARRGVQAQQKRSSSLLASLCAVLFVVSFVMGVGLIRNQDRIYRMEGEIRQLVTAHRNLFAQISNPEFAPAFAEANPPQTSEQTPPAYEITPQPEQPQTLPEPPPEPTPVTETPPPDPPAPAPEPTPPSSAYYSPLMPSIPTTYTIQPGDSLLVISLYFFGDANMVNEIMAINGIEDPDHIVAGRTISLPQR